ncbi:MAG: response regulator [Candidatus Hydrogenedentes bacterium]|nr:response regulator [Candidatus Hydrogenedentota bacterium]
MLNDLRILVVDDDASLLEVVATYLESNGHIVRSCESGEDALDAMKDQEFDLVLSDVAMAGLNGFELLRATRDLYPDIGFVLMTAYEKQYPLSEALEAGADGYLSKPFTLKKLSLIFERAYWKALSRSDWWDAHTVGK